MSKEQNLIKRAKLQFVSDDSPGIKRIRSGKRFRYVDPRGKVIKGPRVLKRIHGLVIPPAWQDVWICSNVNGHIQAVGRDERGRKQYRYHPRWEEARDTAKYDRLAEFAEKLPSIRQAVRSDLRLPGMPRKKILATIVKLLETSRIRVGNEEYVKQNGSFGLTTFRDGHAKVRGKTIQFKFRGKSGKSHNVEVNDRRLAKIVRKCQDLPGQRLFEYIDDDGSVRAITSNDVNEYVKETTGADFTAKDFRTWAGTVQATIALGKCPCDPKQTAAKKQVAEAIRMVAHDLGNTPAVCRKCYVHPIVIDAFLKGKLRSSSSRSGKRGLSSSEKSVLRLLRTVAK